jgi:hypothetical protein
MRHHRVPVQLLTNSDAKFTRFGPSRAVELVLRLRYPARRWFTTRGVRVHQTASRGCAASRCVGTHNVVPEPDICSEPTAQFSGTSWRWSRDRPRGTHGSSRCPRLLVHVYREPIAEYPHSKRLSGAEVCRACRCPARSILASVPA